MADFDHIHSRPYKATACCERCVFGRGEHAEWCEMADENPLVLVLIDPETGEEVRHGSELPIR